MAPADSSQPKVEKLDFPEDLKKRAREFFTKGAEVAYTLNYDYAIELYLDGLNFWPDAVDEGHQKLREIALQRQAAGHKKSGFGDKSKYKKGLGKGKRDDMLKAEYLWSKDPSNLDHLQAAAKAALDANFFYTAHWMCDVLFSTNLQSEKPNFQKFVFIRDAYDRLEDYSRAVQAAQQALQLKPNDDDLKVSAQDLATRATMQRGNYDSESNFLDSVKDRETQEQLRNQEEATGARAMDAREKLVRSARHEYQEEPTIPGKVDKFVKALTAMEKPEYEKEALDVLEKAAKDLNQFRFIQRAGEIRIKQLQRLGRQYKAAAQQQPDNAELKTKYQQAARKLLATELQHYKACVENYPTDVKLKLEYGKRLMQSRQFDDAIPMFQEASRDPRLRVMALNYLGQCWYYREWFTDAIDTFQRALEAMENSEDNTGKEIRYNLGRAYEADGDIENALDSFRGVAQIDFNFRDVKHRVDELRKKQKEQSQ